MLLDSEGIELPRPNTLDVFVTYMGDAKLPAFQLVERLREAGVKADMDSLRPESEGAVQVCQ